ncbi:hypothetical protein H0H87_004381, partial [Tephrocybe sp. NHM501043]
WMKYQTSLRHQNTGSMTTSSSGHLARSHSASSIAARSQGHGYARLTGINVSVRRSTSMASGASRGPSSPQSDILPVPAHEPTPKELIDQDARALREDERIVEQELKRYIDDGVSDTAEHLSDLTRRGRLNFTGDLIADEKDYTIAEPVTGTAVSELLEAGKLQELEELLSNIDDTF